MPKEVYNIKGELVSSDDSDERWYQLSGSTWLLIAGLILFNVGCFIQPGLIDSLLDVRLWPWWYFLFLGIIVAFSIRWFLLCLRWDDYDGNEADTAMRFVRLSIAVTGVLMLWIFLHAMGLLKFFYHPLYEWFGFGTFSWMAAFAFLLLLGVIAMLAYFFKEWIVVFWER